MNFSQDEIAELKRISPDLAYAEEGGYSYFLLKDFNLPEGCQPNVVDLLLCPTPRDGYPSRLFFSALVSSHSALNWNGKLRALGKNWYAVSWRVQGHLRLVETLLVHLKALRR